MLLLLRPASTDEIGWSGMNVIQNLRRAKAIHTFGGRVSSFHAIARSWSCCRCWVVLGERNAPFWLRTLYLHIKKTHQPIEGVKCDLIAMESKDTMAGVCMLTATFSVKSELRRQKQAAKTPPDFYGWGQVAHLTDRSYATLSELRCASFNLSYYDCEMLGRT